jgi:hypothetical protein
MAETPSTRVSEGKRRRFAQVPAEPSRTPHNKRRAGCNAAKFGAEAPKDETAKLGQDVIGSTGQAIWYTVPLANPARQNP